MDQKPKKEKELPKEETQLPKIADIDSLGLQKGKQPSYTSKYDHLFNKQNFEKLPPWQEWDHAIDFIPNAPKAIPAKNYNFGAEDKIRLGEFIEKELKAGKICYDHGA